MKKWTYFIFIICNLGLFSWIGQRLILNNPLSETVVDRTPAKIQDTESEIYPITDGNRISDAQKLKLLTALIYEKSSKAKIEILKELEDNWEPDFVPVMIEYVRLSPDRPFVREVIKLLNKKTGQNIGQDFISWLEWVWESEPSYGAYYGDFKGDFYQFIDPKFRKYFHQRQTSSNIRLDEIVWGGVKQDGIPPLRFPDLISAEEADYLDGDNIVFGIYMNGEAKAYPKRILAWHEFVTDTFGDTKVAGVYCTLCGTMIAYDMVYRDTFHDLGTSGFLYLSLIHISEPTRPY